MVVDMGFMDVTNLRKQAGELHAPIDPLKVADYPGGESDNISFPFFQNSQ